MDDWMRSMHSARAVLAEPQLPDSPPAVRPVVYESWKRCRLQGLEPHAVTPGAYRETDFDSYLTRVVTPLVEKRGAALEQAMCALSLTDQDGRLLRRWSPDPTFAAKLDALHVVPGFSVAESDLGTTSAISLLSGSAVLLQGPEHFSDRFHHLSCAGAPIVHPVTRRTIGSLDLTCRLSDTSPFVLSWVMELAADVQDALRHAASRREQLLLDSYLAHNRDTRHPVVALDQNTIITNAAAARLVGDVDQALLWEHASRAITERSAAPRSLTLTGGLEVTVETKPITDGPDVVGATLQMKRSPVAASARRPAASPRALPGLVGRSSRWQTVCARAQRVAPATQRLLVVGEPGTGRCAVARAVAPQGPVRIIEVPRASPRLRDDALEAWLHTLETEFDGPAETIVLRHVDRLDPTASRATDEALRNRPSGGLVVGTSEIGPYVTAERHPLLDTFDEVIELPAMRDRLEDLPDLIREFTSRVVGDGPEVRWMPDALQALSRLDWPGNVASVEALVQRLLSHHRRYITVHDLPAELVARTARRPLAQLEQAEARAITRALRDAGGNKHKAAESLGIARSTLYRKVRALGLDLSTAAY